ncbi:hypothetical protein AcW1_009987 [Taiwanofungus camphoratus]|nr:hypothetical protein AcV5_003179 [Antrodia cinnamomea]KAI0946551.1 hypothetical protein AcW1_009987 [Antrodia cinnamomea]KAI0946553.1 hypothetical protein AcW1_009987 [Antrodia cinnamomea]
MRLQIFQLASVVTYALTLFSVPAAHARAPRRPFSRGPQPLSRELSAPGPQPGAITLRQYHSPRALVDTCAYIDANVINDLNLLGILGLGIDIDLDICICLSLLPLLLTADVQLEVLVNLLGIDKLTAFLTIAVNEAPDGKRCTYPPYSHPVCTKDDPCGFQCEPPYVKEDGQCVCPAPLTTCNGVCGSFPHGCGSATPCATSLSGRANSYVQKRIDTPAGITTLGEAQLACQKHETVCGVYGGSSKGFECLDVNVQLESCGGCTVPNPFSPATNTSAVGRDCTTIAGVDSVSCIAGRCAVASCTKGWVVSADGEECDRTGTGADTQSLLASIKGRILPEKNKRSA